MALPHTLQREAADALTELYTFSGLFPEIGATRG